MNKKLHLLLFCLIVFFILYLCRDKIINLIEPYGNSGGISGSIIESFNNQIIMIKIR